MHWFVQENVCQEKQWNELVHQLERLHIPHSIHKVVPFSGELIPPPVGYMNEYNKAWVYGSLSMANVAKAHGWTPGVIELGNWNAKLWNQCHDMAPGINTGPYMLNRTAAFATFSDIHNLKFRPWNYHFMDDELFVRPVNDSKFIKGSIMTKQEILDWAQKICELGDDSGADVKPTDEIMVAEPNDHITMEARFWVVNKQIVTWSSYKVGNMYLQSNSIVPQDLIDFAWDMVRLTHTSGVPPKSYCIDVAQLSVPQDMGSLYPDTFQPRKTKKVIVEYNNINSSGLYDCDIQKLVQAIQIAYS